MAEISAYTKKYNEFTQQLLQRFYEEKKGQNLVLSPFSILMLLAIQEILIGCFVSIYGYLQRILSNVD